MIENNYKYITNAHVTDYEKTICDLTVGHKGMRQLFKGLPQATKTYTTSQLEEMDVVGIYQNGLCECQFCKK